MSSASMWGPADACKLHLSFSTAAGNVCQVAHPLFCAQRDPTEHERLLLQICRANRSHMQGRSELDSDPHRRRRRGGARKTATERQADVLVAIAKLFEMKGFAPSLRELVAFLDIKSTNAVVDLLSALRRKGYIEWSPGVARSIRLLRAPT